MIEMSLHTYHQHCQDQRFTCHWTIHLKRYYGLADAPDENNFNTYHFDLKEITELSCLLTKLNNDAFLYILHLYKRGNIFLNKGSSGDIQLWQKGPAIACILEPSAVVNDPFYTPEGVWCVGGVYLLK